MRATRRRATKPEQLLCEELDRLGLTYVLDRAPLPGSRRRADICFVQERIAVFVDGCFWHGCPQHGTSPKANNEWWKAKLEANRQRDADTDRILTEAGWIVLRFWEHSPPGEAAAEIFAVVTEGKPPASTLGSEAHS